MELVLLTEAYSWEWVEEGFRCSEISACLCGRQKSHSGFIWKRIPN